MSFHFFTYHDKSGENHLTQKLHPSSERWTPKVESLGHTNKNLDQPVSCGVRDPVYGRALSSGFGTQVAGYPVSGPSFFK